MGSGKQTGNFFVIKHLRPVTSMPLIDLSTFGTVKTLVSESFFHNNFLRILPPIYYPQFARSMFLAVFIENRNFQKKDTTTNQM